MHIESKPNVIYKAALYHKEGNFGWHLKEKRKNIVNYLGFFILYDHNLTLASPFRCSRFSLATTMFSVCKRMMVNSCMKGLNFKRSWPLPYIVYLVVTCVQEQQMRLDLRKPTNLSHFVFWEMPLWNIETAVACLCYIIAMQDLLYK